MYQQVQLDYWIIIKIMENTLPLSLLLGGISKERSNHDSYGDNLESFFWLIYWCLISSKQWLITWCVTTVSRRVSLVVLTPPEHLNSPRFQWGSCCSILWFRSSLFFLLFLVIVWSVPSSIYGFWLPLWWLQTFFVNYISDRTTFTIMSVKEWYSKSK